jgi:hypothetical protein
MPMEAMRYDVSPVGLHYVLVHCDIPSTSASTHVHGITPLRCTPAPDKAGANQTNGTPASAANGGPISGVIPITMGGNVTLFGEGFDAAVCAP